MATAQLSEAVDKLTELADAEMALKSLQDKIDSRDKVKEEYKVIFGKCSKDDQVRVNKIKSALLPPKKGKKGGARITKKKIKSILGENNGLTYSEVEKRCLEYKPEASMDNLQTMLDEVGKEKDEKWFAKD